MHAWSSSSARNLTLCTRQTFVDLLFVSFVCLLVFFVCFLFFVFFFGISVEHLKERCIHLKKIPNNKTQLNSQAGRVPSTAAVLPCWIVTATLCIKNWKEWESPDSGLVRWPSSLKMWWLLSQIHLFVCLFVFCLFYKRVGSWHKTTLDQMFNKEMWFVNRCYVRGHNTSVCMC